MKELTPIERVILGGLASGGRLRIIYKGDPVYVLGFQAEDDAFIIYDYFLEEEVKVDVFSCKLLLRKDRNLSSDEKDRNKRLRNYRGGETIESLAYLHSIGANAGYLSSDLNIIFEDTWKRDNEITDY